MTSAQIGANIAARMKAKGWNRQNLANAAGMTWMLADKYVKGTFGPHGPQWNVLERIAAALGCEAADLVGES